MHRLQQSVQYPGGGTSLIAIARQWEFPAMPGNDPAPFLAMPDLVFIRYFADTTTLPLRCLTQW